MTWVLFLIWAAGAHLCAPRTLYAQPAELPGLEGTGITGPQKAKARNKRKPRRRKTKKEKAPLKKAASKAASEKKPPTARKQKKKSKRKKYPPRRRKQPEKKPEIAVEATPPTIVGDTHRNKRYSFKVPRGWRGPLIVDGGMRYASPGGTAFFSIAFHKKGSPGYKTPTAHRRWMRAQGSIVDPLLLDPIKVSGRYGSRVRFTTPVTGGEELFGEHQSLIYTEQILVPDPEGIYILQYSARKNTFERHRLRYMAFLRTLKLPYNKAYKPSQYYQERQHLIEPLLQIKPPKEKHVATNYLIDERFQMGFGLGTPSGFSFRLFYVLNSKWTTGIVFGLAKIKVGDVATSTLGLQTRYYFKDPMQTGWFAYNDLAFVKAGFDGGTNVVEEKASAFVPGLGVGYQRFWEYFTAEGGFGLTLPNGPKQTTRDALGNESTTEYKMPVSLFISGSYRF
jgi:hypothetical protein